MDGRVVDLDFEVRCNYVEIYNEVIYDLLDFGSRNKL
jgi:hypothetical protein